MIIGNGLLAKSFADLNTDEFLIFVSGVSNSLETNPSEFLREETLLRNSMKSYPGKKLVYFSTSSIYDPSKKNSLYVLHKLHMEKIIVENAEKYIIYRVGNVVGSGGNSNTLFNFLVNKIKNKADFKLYKKAKRPLIDVEDISAYFKTDKDRSINTIVDISYPYQYSLSEIVAEIEIYFNVKSSPVEVEEGDQYEITFSKEIFDFFADKNPKHYLSEMVKKYAK